MARERKNPKTTRRVDTHNRHAKKTVNQIKEESENGGPYKQAIAYAVTRMREHVSDSSIRTEINEKFKKYTDNSLTIMLSTARSIIVNTNFSKAEEVIPIHVARYNNQVAKLLATRCIDISEVDGCIVTWKEYYMALEKKINAYMSAIQSLFQKETLLQYHKDDFIININTEETILIKDVKPKIDLSKLTFDEQVELYELIKKSRQDENEIVGVIQPNKETLELIEEVKEIPAEIPNIQFIKVEQQPALPYRSQVTAADPTVKLRETLARRAAQRFKEAGGTLTAEEEKLLE